MRRFTFALMALVFVPDTLPAEAKCPLPRQHVMTEAQLFFGRDVTGRGPVSDNEWSDFTSSVIEKEFPDGFTVTDGLGQWRDAKSGDAVHEQSKIVLIVGRNGSRFAAKLRKIAETYGVRFHQDSVGVVTREVCAVF